MNTEVAPPQQETVLLVENSAFLRAYILEELRSQGFNTIGAINPRDAIYRMSKKLPDSFIISSKLGTEDGIPLARELGKLSKTNSCPLVLILEDSSAMEDLKKNPLHPTVVPTIKYNSLQTHLGNIIKACKIAGTQAKTHSSGKQDGDDSIISTHQSDILAMDKALQFFNDVVVHIKEDKLPGPIVPDLLIRLRKVLSDPNVEYTKIAEFITQHQALSSRILTMANSAYYSSSMNRVSSIKIAIGRLGLSLTRSILQAIAMKDYIVGKDKKLRSMIQDNLQVAFAVSLLCRELGVIVKHHDPEFLCIIGLLHNIGETFMLYSLGLFLDRNMIQDVNYDAIKTIATTHTSQLNHILSNRLKLPEEIGDISSAVAKSSVSVEAVKIVQQGIWLASQLLAMSNLEEPEQIIVDADAELIGLNQNVIDTINSKIPELLEAIRTFASC